MNTNSNCRTVSLAITLAAAASVITVITVVTAGSATASIASEPRGDQVTSNSAFTGSYGEPLAALGGKSLAEYLTDHWDRVIVAGV